MPQIVQSCAALSADIGIVIFVDEVVLVAVVHLKRFAARHDGVFVVDVIHETAVCGVARGLFVIPTFHAGCARVLNVFHAHFVGAIARADARHVVLAVLLQLRHALIVLLILLIEPIRIVFHGAADALIKVQKAHRIAGCGDAADVNRPYRAHPNRAAAQDGVHWLISVAVAEFH